MRNQKEKEIKTIMKKGRKRDETVGESKNKERGRRK